MAKTSRFTRYEPKTISLNSGTESGRDAVLIDDTSTPDSVNIIIDEEDVPQKAEGISAYGTINAGATPIKGAFAWIAEDGIEYELVACNGKLYWTNGNGTYTAVKFGTENVDLTINTTDHFFRFIVFDKVISSTQKKLVYMISDYNPIATNTAGTANKYTAISRAIRLEVSSSVIIAKSVYYDNDSSRTAGADDVEIGQGASEIGWPNKGNFVTKIFDRIIIANYYDDAGSKVSNGWITSEAQNSEDWTNSSVSSNTGGGKSPDAFTGMAVLGTSVLIFGRYSILNVQCTPSAITNWREFYLNTRLGAISQESITVHADGWVYYMSEEGICRTDGRQAERVDLSIENQIKNLSQLKNNARSIAVSGTSDWNAGTPTSGDNLLDTVNGILTQKSLIASGGGSVLLNPSFEDGFTNWTATGVWALVGSGAQQGSNYADKPIAYTAGSGSILIKNSEGTTLKTYVPSNATAWTLYTISAADLTAYIGTSIQLVFVAGSSSLSSTLFTYQGDNINFYYKRTVTGGPSFSNALSIDNIYFDYASFISSVDYGAIPTTLGNLTINLYSTAPSDSIVFAVATSADNITYGDYVDVLTATSMGNYTASLSAITPTRYIKIKATYTSGSGITTLLNMYVGGQWISPIKDLGQVPTSWSSFSLGGLVNGQTLTVEMNTSSSPTFATSDGYATLVDGTTPTNTLRQYIQYRVTFNTTNYTQLPYLTSLTLAYLVGAGGGLPSMISYRNRLYCSLQEDGQTSNNITWIGTTKPASLKYTQSGYTGVIYPLWHKCNFIASNLFGIFTGKLRMYSASVGKVYNMLSGNTNDTTAFTSYIITKALGSLNARSIWRFVYIYSKSNTAYNVYFRTRTGDSDWSAWSTAKSITASANISKKDKWTLPGLVTSDFIQFKIEVTSTDSAFSFGSMDIFYTSKATGR